MIAAERKSASHYSLLAFNPSGLRRPARAAHLRAASFPPSPCHALPARILVVGSGGREHALVKACLASPTHPRVIAAPGNGGIALEAPCFPCWPMTWLRSSRWQSVNRSNMRSSAPRFPSRSDSSTPSSRPAFLPTAPSGMAPGSKLQDLHQATPPEIPDSNRACRHIHRSGSALNYLRTRPVRSW